MEQAIKAYHSITATEEFRNLERMRFDARCNEASALDNAERRGYRKAKEEWQGVIAEKDSRITEKDSRITEKDSRIAELEAQLAKYENK
jgi:hypothetical protein